MTAVLLFPGGAVDATAFRADEAPTQTTRLCPQGKHPRSETGACHWCEAEAMSHEGRIAELDAANKRAAREQETLAALAESESLLTLVTRRSKSGFWRAHAEVARAAVTKAINDLRTYGIGEDEFPTKAAR